jgi:hypothetical protein
VATAPPAAPPLPVASLLLVTFPHPAAAKSNEPTAHAKSFFSVITSVSH